LVISLMYNFRVGKFSEDVAFWVRMVIECWILFIGCLSIEEISFRRLNWIFFIFFFVIQRKNSTKLSLKNYTLKRDFASFIIQKVRMEKKYHTKSDKVWEVQKRKKGNCVSKKFFWSFQSCLDNGPDFQRLELRTLEKFFSESWMFKRDFVTTICPVTNSQRKDIKEAKKHATLSRSNLAISLRIVLISWDTHLTSIFPISSTPHWGIIKASIIEIFKRIIEYFKYTGDLCWQSQDKLNSVENNAR